MAKKVTLTDKQMEALSKFERNFDQALNAGFSSRICDQDLAELLGIWKEITGEERTLRGGCSVCVYHLVKDLGTLYVDQKAAEKAAGEEKPAEGTTTQPKAEKAVKAKEKGKKKK